jgi:hypothetical protein
MACGKRPRDHVVDRQGSVGIARRLCRWGGHFSYLLEASRPVHEKGKLLLAKGIHRTDSEIVRALEYGADLVLVVGRRPPPELAPVCIWEPSTYESLVFRDARTKVMWNARDLANAGQPRKDADITAVRRFHDGWLCQASFISDPKDVDPRVEAFIVGSQLPKFCELWR